MIINMIKVVVVLALIAFFYFKFGIPLFERSRLIKQGVVYMEKPFLSEITEL